MDGTVPYKAFLIKHNVCKLLCSSLSSSSGLSILKTYCYFFKRWCNSLTWSSRILKLRKFLTVSLWSASCKLLCWSLSSSSLSSLLPLLVLKICWYFFISLSLYLSFIWWCNSLAWSDRIQKLRKIFSLWEKFSWFEKNKLKKIKTC